MENWNGATWLRNARERTRGEETRKIAAIHAGIALGVALIITLIQVVLSEGIAQTSGLSGLGMRSILETAGTLLQWANAVATPFWNLGFVFAALLWVRGRSARPKDLLQGFRRFGPYLRLLLAKGMLIFFISLACIYLSSYIFMLTPWAEPVIAFAEAAAMDMEVAGELVAQMDISQVDALLASMIPVFVIWAILCLLVLVPRLYSFRMAEFIMLEEQKVGGVAAMLLSSRMMRKRRWKLFLLDLRLWWYYGLQLLCFGLYFADLWLPMLGVALPFGDEWSWLVFYVGYLISLFAVRTFLRPQVDAAYALVYEDLRQAEPILPKRRTATPKQLPWDEE